MKNINYKFLLFCFFLLLACTFLLTGCGKKVEQEVEEKQEDEIVEVEEEEIVVEDFSKFSNENQEIGNIGNEMYTISSLSEKSMDGFHRFSFEVTGERDLPNVLASYRSDLGIVRLVFKNIEQDNSGLGYQRSYDVNENGVVRIYHNVSADEEEEIYDIGILKSTEFLLHSEKIEDGKWNIFLDIRYPGELDIEIDRGSEDFSQDVQSIEGATSSDGAKITNYSYGAERGAFQFIWTVAGSQSKPIPQVRAEYNEQGELVVTFPDLSSDNIGRNSSEVELIGSVEKVFWNRVGNESTYTFVLSSEKSFKLTSSLSPNQIILEIEL